MYVLSRMEFVVPPSVVLLSGMTSHLPFMLAPLLYPPLRQDSFFYNIYIVTYNYWRH